MRSAGVLFTINSHKTKTYLRSADLPLTTADQTHPVSVEAASSPTPFRTFLSGFCLKISTVSVNIQHCKLTTILNSNLLINANALNKIQLFQNYNVKNYFSLTDLRV